MSERPVKRQGPIAWLKSRSRRFWIVFAVVAPVLYVLSSGPTRYFAFQRRFTYAKRPGTSQAVLMATMDRSLLWDIYYAPLEWASEQSWGGSVRAYWNLFPIRAVVEKS